jgi:redox-regulated HSP33 family molecular chaperone
MNTIRTLILEDAVSLTIIDGTKLVAEGKRIHHLNDIATVLLGKSLLFTAFLSASLKGEKGSVSLSLKGDGKVKDISVSGNYHLDIRGTMDTPSPAVEMDEIKGIDAKAIFEKEGSITMIRDDGYARPFVGAVECVDGDLDRQFEEYFNSSEQLPTFLSSRVELDGAGNVKFAGFVCLQPLPFASESAMKTASDKTLQAKALSLLKEESSKQVAKACYLAEEEKIETTKKCPFCCSEIDIKATRCPHCTSEIPEEEDTEEKTEE